MSDSNTPVYVVGGGWAGLAAAVELTRHRIPTVLLESAKQLGGRARRIPFGDHGVDNGQHLMLGAYEATLDLLRTLGVPEDSVLQRRRLRLAIAGPRGATRALSVGRLPAPLHIAWGLATARGFSLPERYAALRFCAAQLRANFTQEPDCPVQALLARHRQPASLIAALWEPLCLATLNTPIERASTQVFLRVLRDAFANRKRDSDLLYTCADLSAMVPDPAADYIEQHGGEIRLGRKVAAVHINDRGVAAVQVDADSLPCRHLVLATPAHITQRLLLPHADTHSLAQQLDRLGTNPIYTVYLHYAPHVTLGHELLGMVGTLSQWVFDRRIYDQPGLIAVVISGPGAHTALDNTALAHCIAGELAQQFPHWPAPERTLVIREKRATFDCASGVAELRPTHTTTVPGLWLAGDYTQTGLPATLEGAIQSGQQCAQAVIRTLRQANPVD